MTKDVINVIDIGADPSGKSDCTGHFKAALEQATNVLVPAGVYRISGMIKGVAPEPTPPPATGTAEESSTEE
jgi:polygalacturonase